MTDDRSCSAQRPLSDAETPFKCPLTRYNFSFKHKVVSSLCDQEKAVLFQLYGIILDLYVRTSQRDETAIHCNSLQGQSNISKSQRSL